jgi:hypothetical protein
MRREPARRTSWKVVYFNQYNLLLVSGAAVFSLALASRWPLIVGGVAEAIWLIVSLTSRSVRRWAVSHVLDQDRERRVDEAQPVCKTLEPDYVGRLEKIEAVGTDIRRMIWERGLEGALFSGTENRLESLLLGFAKMAALHQRLSRLIGGTDPNLLEQELVALGQSLSSEKDGSIRFVLQQAIGIAQRRFEQRERLENQLRLLGVRMGTLEMSLDYLRSNVFAGRSEKDLAAEITQLMSNLSYLVELETEVNTSVERLHPPAIASVP